MEGRKKVYDKVKDNVVSICIVPPSMKELEKRMRLRKKDSDETIRKRLNKAKEELKHTDDYDYVVVNDTIEQAARDIKKIILDEINKHK